ncbi:LacI family DNA-binding transcriptional regulator [Pseudonocardia nigra]|uniref:LacI family DNA-binding transcriptional regulator n=1 Tax=Pseudonocardia nigra TaxID=1921578 RepID=UPI001C5E3D04|nr:LacI family DNA-binding transcriptional regulator [Pseudonocardia nigra]
MKDIAGRVGVSVKSVSRVVNGEPGVSPATAERILEVARELGFRRNDLARNLRQQDRTGTIGLVLRHSSTRFHDRLVQGIEDVAEHHGALVITAGSRTPERERATLLALSSRRLDGLLVVPIGADHSFLAAEQATGMPLVFVDRPPRHLAADAILADDHGGARAAVDHLVRGGHRRIAVIGAGADLHTVRERVRGYRSALRAAGVEPDERLVLLDREGRAAAEQAVTDLLAGAAPPTALFTTNNVSTIGATVALRRAGAERRVALVGFDDFELADLLDPPLTVVAHDIVEMGRRAAEQLFRRIDGDDAPARTDVLPTRLIPRGSGEIPA